MVFMKKFTWPGLLLLAVMGPVVLSAGAAQGVEKVALSCSDACAINGGKLYCWGTNDEGQLGTGSQEQKTNRPAPVVGLPGPVTNVFVEYQRSCAIAGGGLYCWGQIGASKRTPQLMPGLE